MKRVYSICMVFFVGFGFAHAQLPSLPPNNLNFIVLNDTGAQPDRQAAVAAVAGQLEKLITDNHIAFVIVAGDPIHENGVKSTADPEWDIKVENLFRAPALHSLPWYVISGNHEYKGSVPALLAYSHVSPRWNAPARYYAFERSLGYANDPVLFVFLDTTPLIGGYRKQGDDRSDAWLQDDERELRWMDSMLVTSRAGWKMVIGHHPVYAQTTKGSHEREDMQRRVGTILENRSADFYISGHIHNFQYIRPEGKNVNYIVNGSGYTARPVDPIPGTVACYSEPGFSVYSVSKNTVDFYFINDKGESLYHRQVEKKKPISPRN